MGCGSSKNNGEIVTAVTIETNISEWENIRKRLHFTKSKYDSKKRDALWEQVDKDRNNSLTFVEVERDLTKVLGLEKVMPPAHLRQVLVRAFTAAKKFRPRVEMSRDDEEHPTLSAKKDAGLEEMVNANGSWSPSATPLDIAIQTFSSSPQQNNNGTQRRVSILANTNLKSPSSMFNRNPSSPTQGEEADNNNTTDTPSNPFSPAQHLSSPRRLSLVSTSVGLPIKRRTTTTQNNNSFTGGGGQHDDVGDQNKNDNKTENSNFQASVEGGHPTTGGDENGEGQRQKSSVASPLLIGFNAMTATTTAKNEKEKSAAIVGSPEQPSSALKNNNGPKRVTIAGKVSIFGNPVADGNHENNDKEIKMSNMTIAQKEKFRQLKREEFRIFLMYIADYMEIYVIFDEINLNEWEKEERNGNLSIRNGQNAISRAEFRKSLPKLASFGIVIPEDECDRCFDEIDKSRSGSISFKEFSDWVILKHMEEMSFAS